MTDLPAAFFLKDALTVAPRLLGCRLVVGDRELVITETEAYMGESDTACHAHHGRTKRTEMLYRRGGHVYVYLCYGIHSLLNIITGLILPLGIFFYCRMLRFRLRLHRDLKNLRQASDAIVKRIETMN